jgi:hypothetical protein
MVVGQVDDGADRQVPCSVADRWVHVDPTGARCMFDYGD